MTVMNREMAMVTAVALEEEESSKGIKSNGNCNKEGDGK